MHFKNIVITTDFSEDSFRAFDAVAYEGKMEGSKLSLVTVAEDWEVPPAFYGYLPDPKLVDDYREEHRKKLEEDLQKVAKEKFHGVDVTCAVIISSNPPSDEINKYAKDNNADLLVIGSHGRGGLASFVLGSTAQKVIKGSPCPVLVIPRAE